MRSDPRGPLLYAYKPIPANPMSVALLILLAVVTLVLGPVAAAPEGLWPLGGFCFLPLVLALVFVLAFKPSPTFVFEDGIEVSLPLWQRLRGDPRYFLWETVRDVYPASYEVAGSFLSPFASSAGTLVHVGLGIETRDGRRRLVRFTPGVIRGFRAESPAFQETIAVIRDRFARHGQPWVTTAKPLSDSDVLAMQARARQPLTSIAAVFFAFFLPPALVAGVFVVVSALGLAITTPVALVAVVFALAPPGISMARTLRKSEERNKILSELAKFQESLRQAGLAMEPGGSTES